MTEVVWFADERCLDVACAGGKGASLARMTAEGLPVPPGFVVPSSALAQAVDGERLAKLAVFPIKWIGTTAAPVRAVAILDE